MGKKLISLRIDEELKREMDRLVSQMKKTQTEIIEIALKEILKKKRKN